MSAPFAWKLAWREARASWRRMAIYMGAITLGVAALVAINSFRSNVIDSVRAEARTLLGADVRLESGTSFSDAVQAVLDSAAAAGVPVSYVTTTPAMGLVPRTGRTRLFQLRAVSPGFPHYGAPVTEPPGRWDALPQGGVALVDPALLVQLDAVVGDTIQVGAARFAIAGTVAGLPAEVGFQAAIGPRIFVPATALQETQLLAFGSLVRYQAFLELSEGEMRRFVGRYRRMLQAEQVQVETAESQARSMVQAYGALGNFLGLVGLTALLLGGVGVASAVHVFVKEKLAAVAVLRCLGATQRQVFLAYLGQAVILGAAGSAAGVALGLGLQAVLPRTLGDLLPLPVPFSVEPHAVLTGLAIGVWVAGLFSLLPLLGVRDVAPLQALRRDYDAPAPRHDVLRYLVVAALAASVLGLSVWQAGSTSVGTAFAAGLALTAALLWATAAALIRATRRFFPRRAPYVVRQGIANLFRPRNQTVVVTLSVGFGVFLLATLYLVQRNLLDRLELSVDGDRPSLLLFDVRPDQRVGVENLFAGHGVPALDVTPIAPARLSHVNGRGVDELLADPGGPPRWALRREYRHTYRDTAIATETVVAGRWWGADGEPAPAEPPAGFRISMEEGLAASLGVGVGDRVTWDFQGVAVETRIANLRAVDWTSFSPNFFVVFEPGSIDTAPHSLVALGHVPDAERRLAVQRDLVRSYPNISALDLAVVQEAIDLIARRVTLGIRVLAAFAISGGVLVLIGALASSRYQRRRESALLKMLGASRRQVARVLLVEYFALGSLAALTGAILATVAAWLLVERLFQMPFVLPAAALAGVWLSIVVLTLAVGLLNSVDVLRRSPLTILQDAHE